MTIHTYSEIEQEVIDTITDMIAHEQDIDDVYQQAYEQQEPVDYEDIDYTYNKIEQTEDHFNFLMELVN